MILLDTQVVLWLTQERRLLSPAAVQAIRQANRQGGGTGIASSTLWEIAMLYGKGRVTLRGPLPAFLEQCERVFTVLPITAAIAAQTVRFGELFPVDPTGRLIGATAVIHGLRLITADQAIRRSGEVECVW